MEKRFLLLSALALCLSPVMMAQDVDPDKPIWEFNFDDGDMSMFDEDDDASIAGEINGVTYYILPVEQEVNSSLKFGLDTTPKFTVDTTIVIRHNVSPYTEGDRDDEYTLDESTDYDNDELSKLGVTEKSVNFFRYFAKAKEGKAKANVEDYQANLFVRNLPIEEHSSYRVSYYMRVDSVNAHLDVRLLRGWFDSEKPFAMDGKGSKTFIQEVKGSDWVTEIAEGINDTIKENLNHWKRYTYMTYYSSADTLNKFCQNQYYWSGLDSRWNSIFQDARQRGQVPPEIEEKMYKKGTVEQYIEWGGMKIKIGSTDYDSIFASRIEQPNTFFLRFAFRGGNTTYDIDNIALYKSTIAYAEYSGAQIRLNFGYETNMKEVIDNNGGSKLGRIDVSELELFQLSADGGDAPEIEHVEFQSDGMVYLWLDGTPEEDVKLHLTFDNASAESGCQLKYLADKLYPYFDRIGVEDNLVVPGFKNELVLPSGFAAVPGIEDVPPVLDTDNPASVELKPFGLDNATQRAFTFNFNKKVYINPDDFDYTIKATIYGGLPGYEIEKDAFTLELLNEESSQSVTFVVPDKDDYMQDIVLKGVYTIELYCLHADLDGEPSDFSEADYGDGPIKVEYSWGDPQDIIDADKRSTAYIYNKKVTDAYNADMAELDKVADITSPAVIGLREFVAQYEPVAFLQNNQAPSQYDAAEKALKDKLPVIKEVVNSVHNYEVSVKRAVEAKAAAVAFKQTNKYKDLSDVLADTAIINPNVSEAEELLAYLKQLHHVTINGESLPWVVAQANALFKLSNDLGNDLSGDTYVTGLMNNMENDNPTLNEVLKLNVKKALLNKIKALGEGQTTDSIEVSPLFDNYRFYSTALLGDDKDIKSYNAGYHGVDGGILCYRIGSKADSLRVFPGWKFGSTTSDGSHFGFWPSRGDQNWPESSSSPLNDNFRGDYCESADEALAGTVACDWNVSFVLMQTLKDLPAGQYTIQAPGHYSNATKIKNDLLIANQDTAVNTNVDATETEPAIVGIDSMTVTTVLEQPGDIAFKMTHEQMESGFLMYNMIMYFKGAKDPSFNYDMAIAAIDQQISDIKSEAAAVVAAKKVELYNINGVKINNAEPGQIVIRVTDGIAEKIVAE